MLLSDSGVGAFESRFILSDKHSNELCDIVVMSYCECCRLANLQK